MFATHEERATRGAKWLDRASPGWHKKIDPGTLDMRSETRCVMGQVFGNFSDVMNAKFFVPNRYWGSKKILLMPGVYIGMIWSVRHGFQTGTMRAYEDEALRAAWFKQIEARENPLVADTFPAGWARERTPAATIER